MSKHTPGSWFIRYCDDDYHQCMTVISSKNYGSSNMGLYDDESDTIAIVYHQLTPCVGAEHNSDEHDANVRLIAAAPELLEALEESLAFLEFAYRDIQMNDYSFNLLEETTNKVRVAIAKAKGEE